MDAGKLNILVSSVLSLLMFFDLGGNRREFMVGMNQKIYSIPLLVMSKNVATGTFYD